MSWQALVARLDNEIAGKLGLQRQLTVLQDKVRDLELALEVASGSGECQLDTVNSSGEEQRMMFHEARKVRIPGLAQASRLALDSGYVFIVHRVSSDEHNHGRLYVELMQALVGRLDEEVATKMMLQKQLAATEAKLKAVSSAVSTKSDREAHASTTDFHGQGEALSALHAETCSELRKCLMATIDKEVAEKSDLQKKLDAVLLRVPTVTKHIISKENTPGKGDITVSSQDQVALLPELLSNQALGFEAARKVRCELVAYMCSCEIQRCGSLYV